ncbi:putative protein N-terminal asparagine amidohydrolase [Aspergillus mulundensis]|uniref:CN hydrolase domain-containing protein n=1 Tax=Aspergillus mulundensis TaxID=1810919 RepID=A0A3D8RK29_9EURO|nr:hypothetical protein DSM5745_06992 [Aspergillus mulundensis]RDW74330.1 hypothetical protein DSM5745_06992 [Aspergillus mulundensis]
MRIATLQIASRLGNVEGNIKRADELLSKGISIPDGFGGEGARVRVEDAKLDILVLSELALTGYNFPSLEAIKPYLEPAGQGPSAAWARKTAKQLGCKVCVGYPEVEVTNNNGQREEKYYNSLLVLDEQGNTLLNYRKTFLYYTDETWASEGSAELGFHQLTFPSPGDKSPSSSKAKARVRARADGEAAILPPAPATQNKTGNEIATSFGICMDINPYRFEAPYTAYEFAHRVLDSNSQLVILSMAWLTLLSREELDALGNKPELDTFNYWVQRFMPLIRKQMGHARNADASVDADADAETETEKNIIIVFANRAGEEDGAPSPARYAGTSTIVAVSQRQRGGPAGLGSSGSSSDDEMARAPPLDVKILCWDMLGATEEGLCFADTAADPRMVFQLVRAGDR